MAFLVYVLDIIGDMIPGSYTIGKDHCRGGYINTIAAGTVCASMVS